MWRTVKRATIGLVILVLLIWSGILWAFLSAVPLWTYVTIFIFAALVTGFVVKMWQQNEVTPLAAPTEPVSVDYIRRQLVPGEEDIVDAEIIDD